jgi:small subunit ribosomal protein S8
MLVLDPIADMLTRIRNANSNKSETVVIPQSKTKLAIAEILKEEGFIVDYKSTEVDGIKMIEITLKYGPNGEKVIQGLKRISKPGLRIYANAEQLPKVLNGLGIAIISSSKGIITDKNARKLNVGGEVLAYVW